MITALLIAVASFAEIDPASKALAAKIFAEGETAFQQGQFAAAALAFERAGRLVAHPSAWLNAAEAWEREGSLERAAEDCDRVLELVELAPKFAAEARLRLARLEPRIGALEVRGPHDRPVKIDGLSADRPPFTKRLAPGVHRIEAGGQVHTVAVAAGETSALDLGTRSEGRPAEHTPAERTPAERRRIDLDLAETSTRTTVELLPPNEASDSESDADGIGAPPVASWIAFGTAAIALGAGVTFGSLTLSAKHEYDDAPTLDRADLFFERRRTANILYGATLLSAAVGFGLWILGDDAI